MKRLESFPDRTTQPSQPAPPNPESSVAEHAGTGQAVSTTEEHVEYSEEEDESEDDYGEVGDDGRGLLTDIPLILAPAEIEVLPMIIMSGIVPPASNAPGHGSTAEEIHAIKNMHTVRCHLLLAQDNGRNLLRELLIFVAAWDLREDELYYRFMVKIMDAILMNGLMPFSYHAFRETKDIISPAQAVIMKLLTNIFRQRQAASAKTKTTMALEADDISDQYPPKVDVHLVNFLFTEFRRHIIPQTCALIFLQGQIRARNAYPEDFPLNLWDMERMYEGVYQYLEFFAVMTEHPVWKGMMADWDIASELVTLLKELDAAIPKKKPFSTPRRPNGADNTSRAPAPANSAPAVSVERPYDRSAPSMPMNVPEIGGPDPDTFTEDSPEDASEFEWRNLKKLAVLVLSSLVWKSRKIQDQVREHGGIEAVLACTNYDEHNPYIREHAIMCLRFLTEGNTSNQSVIRSLEPQKPVPAEVLDNAGYETVMDDNGQVRLKRKEAAARQAAGSTSRTPTSTATTSAGAGTSGEEGEPEPSSSSPSTAAALSTGIDPASLQSLVGSESLLANLPAWMQQVMKDVPGGVSKTVENDPEKAAALAKLDRAFGVDKKG
jgi:palmitoyltransferase